jgi:hypothetical protein
MSAKAAVDLYSPEVRATAPGDAKLAGILKLASPAPTMEERRGWQFRLAPGGIELVASLYTDPDPRDPDGREMLMHCGGALFRLLLAMKWSGCLGPVEMFPDLDDSSLVARITPGSGRGMDTREKEMFQAMTQTPERLGAAGVPASEAALAALAAPLPGEKAWLEFSKSETSRHSLLAFTSGGRPIPGWLTSPDEARVFPAAPQEEPRKKTIFGFLAAATERSRSGPSLTGFSRRAAAAGDLRFVTGSTQPVVPAVAALAVLKTKTDDPHGWLAAGQVRTRVRLQARALGISSHIFDDAFKRSQCREQLRTAIGRKGFVQAIVGFGSRAEHADAILQKNRQAPAHA